MATKVLPIVCASLLLTKSDVPLNKQLYPLTTALATRIPGYHGDTRLPEFERPRPLGYPDVLIPVSALYSDKGSH